MASNTAGGKKRQNALPHAFRVPIYQKCRTIIAVQADTKSKPKISHSGVLNPSVPNSTTMGSVQDPAASETSNGELTELFAPSAPDGLPADVLGELQSIMRVHGITAQELFYRWESYCLRMGSEETKLDLETVRLFKRDVQDNLERQARGRQQVEKRSGGVAATPRARERDMGMGAGAGTGDVFGM